MDNLYLLLYFPILCSHFFLFHGCRLYGSLYQLFHETKRYHPGNAKEDRLYYGGLDPACVVLDDTGRLIKSAYSKECLRGVDYAILTFFGIAWLLSVPLFFILGMILKFENYNKLLPPFFMLLAIPEIDND